MGLIDGIPSTLAPIFAAALLAGPRAALFVGLATALGAGISMGLSEALSDDGSQTGRGPAITRGAVTGMMTTLGGLFHALPFLIPNLSTALICKRYLAVTLRASLVQVALGGALIVAVGLSLGRV